MRHTRKQIAMTIKAFAPEGCKLPPAIEKDAARKTGGVREKPENQLQKICCEWLRLQRDVLFFSVPNHLYRGKGANYGKFAGYMTNQKSMGLTAGVSDLVIILKRKTGGVNVVFAELKCGKNQLTETQTQFHSRAKLLGCEAVVIKDVTDLIDVIRAVQMLDKQAEFDIS